MSDDVSIDSYRRVNVLQTGQNSEVWEVVDPDGRKHYTMKLLLPERVHDADQRRMLKHEANVGITLQHPKIIKFYKCKLLKDHPYILMEYFPSINLKLRIMRKQQDEFLIPRMRSLLDQMFSALAYFHSKGWVHRDIKPDNVLINGSGEIRLIDFALAVRTTSFFSRLFTSRKSTTAGTRSYMSPEQIRGRPLDARADIYSFGVMMYEMLTGKLPFIGISGRELFQKHLNEKPAPITNDKNYSTEFLDLVMSMLAKKPEGRPVSFASIQDSLRRIRIFKDEALPKPGDITGAAP